MSLIPGDGSLCCLPDPEQPAVCGGVAEDPHHGHHGRHDAQQEADLDPVAKC